MREGKTIQLQRGAAFLPSFDSSSQCFFHSLCSISLLTRLSWRTAHSLLGKPRFLFLSHLCHWLKNITSQHIMTNGRWSWRDSTNFDSENDYRTGCPKVSHCQQQQSYSGLHSTDDHELNLLQKLFIVTFFRLSDYMMSFKEWVSQQKSDNFNVSWSFGRMLSINEKNKSNSQLLKGSITVLYLANFSCMSTGQASTKYSKILKSKEREFLQIL